MKVLIESERLSFREIGLKDLEVMFQMHSDLEVQRYTGEPPVKSRDEMEVAIRTRLKDYRRHGYGRWAVLLKGRNTFIGWAGLAFLPEFDEIDLGYRFLPEYWGRGYATEAARAILRYGFDSLLLDRIVAIALKEHKASIRVMEKIGMKFEKYAPYEPGSIDAAWYSMTKSSFEDT